MAKVYAPNQQYTGVSASVPFVNGVGETDNPHLLRWFEDRGYFIERSEPEKEPEGADDKTGEPPAETPEKEPEAPEKTNGKKPKGDK
ncbi:hypothetical protein WJ0W_006207 [Paenibacillus melissococcoides]|uniref:Uncharacterized protein n=1 Tax=Paenibacillus melissococcoides TaxID=2912268 RepID=A0ABN8U6V6_9BACL|nr:MULTISPECIES: hypothetical protein [Paenibacillus]CAH8246858.1 hypothetical protein WJ0W_004090 [Paenibacillus melissococcoides]CAH8249020.1 hypothetical protein WJ0W_006207 [Paenibacillus melissococcoides]CAH8710733.1 hypothetical protein HTL2_002731 [Paenibacillus melissococcoides]CAH8715969.1 hypothetical protein HTL2_004460 [Paenibacillus melissococcoides]CAH8716923.1 hypothetical protein WDD9_004727 [Paenibacillus melissococcoides]